MTLTCLVSFEWAASAAYTTEVGAWEVMANVLYGESQDGDAAYGLGSHAIHLPH